MSEYDPIHTETRDNGTVVKLYVDTDPTSPAAWDNLGTLYIADNQVHRAENVPGSHDYTDAVQTAIREETDKGNTVLPCRFDDYGSRGAKLYPTDADDANAYLLATDESYTLIGTPRDRGLAVLADEAEEWNTYLQGEVYGYTITTAEGTPLDSLWGLYGYDYALQEANSAADAYDAEDIRLADVEALTLQAVDLAIKLDVLKDKIAARNTDGEE